MFDKLRRQMGERFSSVWVLLTDTDRFVARAGLLPLYERQLREWRQRLNRGQDGHREVRDEIIGFRKQRRLEGWELRLGSLDVQVKGFRSDNAMAVGFRRMVLMLGEGYVRYIVGEANHVELDELLSEQVRGVMPEGYVKSHYLWFRRIEGVLELAGSDSESEESLVELEEFVSRNKSLLVRHLYRLI